MKPPLVQKHTRIKIYKTLGQPTLAYGSRYGPLGKWWNQNHSSRNAVYEAYSRFYKMGPQTKWGNLEELKTKSVLECTGKQRHNQTDHVNRTDRKRIPEQILQYALWGWRSTGHPAKRWLQTINRPHGLTCVWKMTMIMMIVKITRNTLSHCVAKCRVTAMLQQLVHSYHWSLNG
jgi:hypothetical protein